MQLSGYSVDRLRDDGEFILYRGRTPETERPSVLLLAPASARPSPETLKKIDHEYSLSSDLDTAWAVRPVGVSDRGAQITLVLEDPGGETLDGLILGPMAMPRFLGLAVGLATALGGVHKSNLIHKDVKPSNVLVNSATGQVRLIGFGIASRLRREHQPPEPPEFIAGTLPYMAPEQTGRMNRSIDSRSDLYALGVTLYEMLTGTRPFTASEPLEWVHSHIARIPVAPHERLTNVPACVSALVMKLLAKTPEERYQTASGVESDLRRCLAEWEACGRIVDFSPGQHDAQDRLLIPEKLYGRAGEIETLLTAFDRVVAGGRPELVLVSGYSGIGKSAVVNELHKPLVPPRGLFASGKFDQYKRDIPYATLAQAFQSLTRPLLSKSEEDLRPWRDALHDALDPNGQLMVALVPELKAIIGEQPPVPELPQQDAQRRFHLVFRRFLGVFARPEHPLALFLDDLQWLDAATLDLMEDLLTQPDVAHLLLIGAYRDNEVDPTHPLVRKLQAMRKAGALLQDIVLAPLTREDLEQLVADSLHCEPRDAAPLAELVHDKTSGNPFFAIQFLSTLFEESLLTFDHVEGRWSWDLNRIHAKGYTDNVVDLMVSKLSRLVPETQNALKQLACLGNSAEFTMLRLVYQDSVEQLHAQLAEAVGAGFILRSKGSYRFLHDRVQEAAYFLIPEEGRAQAHLRIGMLMASHTPPDRLEEEIFEIVNQLNRGPHLITSIAERERIAELNLIAGRRAKISTAYASALTYLHAGRGLLTDETWNHNYDLVFSIEYLLAACELLTKDMAAAENRLSMLAERAKSGHDIALVTRLRLTLYTALDRSDRAVEVFLEFWRGRGTDWSPHPTEEEVLREYDHVWSLLGNRQIEELVDLPLMINPDVLDALDVFTEIVTPALWTDAGFHALVICRMVSLSLEHGNSDGSCYAYVWLGMLAGSHFGNYQAGFRFGKLGYDLVEQRGLHRYQARTYMSFGSLITPWTKHVKTGRELQRRCFNAANRIGDLTYAAYSCNVLNTNLLAAGDPLADVQREAETGLEFATDVRFGLVIDIITAQLGLIRTLRGLTARFGVFSDERFDELRFERHLASDPVLALPECWYWIRKVQARFFAGDYPSAIEASLNAERLLWKSPSLFEVAEYHFYSALSRAASFDSAADDSRQRHFQALAAHQKQHEIWAQHCPENFENRAALVGAEIARIESRVLEAEHLYEQAIRSAHENGFVNNEAIAYELAARFYAARGLNKFADTYLLEARYCYQRWGADGKVAQLDRLRPDLEKKLSSAPTSAILARTELLDLATVMKVSQAVSGGMVLEPLIDSLMRAAIEHAGAERGLLIRPQGDQLLIEAEAAMGGDAVTVHQRDASANAAVLPESVVRYVIRTRHDVILDDATAQNPFSADFYIFRYRVRSILCLPLINQANLTGVLYLENNLAARVFTPDRITVLKVLASQAAISLENSRLYRDLEDRERARNRLVAVRADVNLALATDNTLSGILQSCADAVVKHLNAALARIWVITKDQRFLELHASAGMSQLEGVHHLVAVGHLNIGRIAQERTPHVTNDVVNDPRFIDRDWAPIEGMVSFAGFPLLAGGQAVGVLAMFSSEPISQAATETLGTISDTIAHSIQRKHAEEAVRRSETFLAEAQALSQTGSWGWNTATGELFWSRETYRIFGFESDVNPTLPMVAEAIHPDDRARFEQDAATLARDHTDFEREYRLKLRDGSIKHVCAVGRFAVRGFPDLDFIGAIMDVTERKQAADALLDERVAERTRIARELHDTLLQSFQGLMLRFQSARHLLPEHPAEAVEALDGALDRADQAITEGRDAIQNLRSSTTVSNELAQAITSLAEELTSGADGEKSSATFRISVEGSPRDLHPIVRDDIHRIAREALRNAFRHAQAAHIEAEVTYGVREVRLRIRDDGKGIDTKHLSAGRARHWGLAGMRERAEQIGARLNLWSKAGAGTEVELRIPGSVAYGAPGGRVGLFRLSSKQGGGA